MKDKFMTKCSTEFKETAFRKMMPPDAMPIRDVRQETGVTNGEGQVMVDKEPGVGCEEANARHAQGGRG